MKPLVLTLALLLTMCSASSPAKSAPVPIQTATGLNVQEYWQGDEPRYWIGNRSAAPLSLVLVARSTMVAGSSKAPSAPDQNLSLPANGAADIDATPYLTAYHLEFRTPDNVLLGEMLHPRNVATSLDGTTLRLYSSLNGTVPAEYNIWYSLPHVAAVGDQTMTTTLNVIGFSGVIAILPGDAAKDGMTVTKVTSATSPVMQNKAGAWFVDTRKLSKVSSLQTVSITCNISSVTEPSFAILHATMNFPHVAPVSLDRGFLVGALPIRMPVSKSQPKGSVRAK